jgi:hypothetical protein
MNSSERRVVHLYLRDNPGVTTQSEGNGDNRRVKVSPCLIASSALVSRETLQLGTRQDELSRQKLVLANICRSTTAVAFHVKQACGLT